MARRIASRTNSALFRVLTGATRSRSRAHRSSISIRSCFIYFIIYLNSWHAIQLRYPARRAAHWSRGHTRHGSDRKILSRRNATVAEDPRESNVGRRRWCGWDGLRDGLRRGPTAESIFSHVLLWVRSPLRIGRDALAGDAVKQPCEFRVEVVEYAENRASKRDPAWPPLQRALWQRQKLT
jgi:hypothetical protein